jgi:hypothetical protein
LFNICFNSFFRYQDQDDYRRPSFFDDMDLEGKDDSKILVDPTLIDKKFNFWNLPASAKVRLFDCFLVF